MTTASTRERQARITEAWARHPDLTESQVAAEVDAELAYEAEAEAERRAQAAEFTDSFVAMTACPLPGCRHGRTATGLCETHSLVLAVVQAERAGSDTLPDGRTVREWVTALAEERAGRTA
jgi:hypothetical protein